MTSVPLYAPINDDNILEDVEDFTLTIRVGLLPNGVTRGVTGQATVIIVDNDCKPNVYVLFCVANL